MWIGVLRSRSVSVRCDEGLPTHQHLEHNDVHFNAPEHELLHRAVDVGVPDGARCQHAKALGTGFSNATLNLNLNVL